MMTRRSKYDLWDEDRPLPREHDPLRGGREFCAAVCCGLLVWMLVGFLLIM